MQIDSAKQRSKAIRMIIIGFAGPFVLIILLLIASSIFNFVYKSLGDSESLVAIKSLFNILFLIIGIIAVSGFVWGPIIGIFGIVKLSKLNKQSISQTSFSSTASDPNQSVQNASSQTDMSNLSQQSQTPNDQNIQKGGDNNVT